MKKDELASRYRAYIKCLNSRDWCSLDYYVDEDVYYNGKRIGLAGYRSMLEDDCRAVPDLSFQIALLLSDPPHIASRLAFDCTPVDLLFDIPVHGRRVQFEENVFYHFANGRIEEVWSIIDKSAIARQVSAPE